MKRLLLLALCIPFTLVALSQPKPLVAEPPLPPPPAAQWHNPGPEYAGIQWTEPTYNPAPDRLAQYAVVPPATHTPTLAEVKAWIKAEIARRHLGSMQVCGQSWNPSHTVKRYRCWVETAWQCLNFVAERESGWRITLRFPGVASQPNLLPADLAYGFLQFKPMSQYLHWAQTRGLPDPLGNGITQARFFFAFITPGESGSDRYWAARYKGHPCRVRQHSLDTGWW